MNKRVLYIVIVVAVLVIAIALLGPKLFGGAKPPPTAARGRKTTTTDSATTAKKAARGRSKVRAAKGKAAREEAAQAPTPVETAPPAVLDTTPLVWGDDPFVRDWLMAGELRDLKVRAVTLGERPLALINDRVVARGDTINGKRIAAITRDSVVFEFGGQRRGLKIGE
ncbi:MAG: hypothetical protein ABIK62_07105 [candidate division WOR-3 bacterium]